MKTSVLISGAGVGGSTLAYWLADNGFQVTVVERAGAQRSSGNPVDVRGPAVDVVNRMGVLPELRKAATSVDRISFVDAKGAVRASVRTGGTSDGAGEEVELPRAELAAILLDAARDRAEIRWGDTITGLTDDGQRVAATFAESAPATYDYVIGADGLHSGVRRLVFGEEREFVRHKGFYVATLPIERALGREREVIMYNTPGRSVSVHPAGGKPLAAFIFRGPETPDYDYRDTAQHKRLVLAAYTGRMGAFGDLLDQVGAAPDLYFDAVCQVRMASWSRGRVALLGDAGSSLSLFGDGSTLAITGAHTLAEELTRTPADPHTAFTRYEHRHRRLLAPKQRGFRLAGALMVPASRPGILARDTVVRLLPRI
ncbi:FAD-dependent monooxygenase [Nocardia sp. NPDC020380]|uniref:FAD-dependent monooxygenase n=1 Tax=Nocardia sp. NPDC020380 TaxID=3364309 RepID=UPI00379283C7